MPVMPLALAIRPLSATTVPLVEFQVTISPETVVPGPESAVFHVPSPRKNVVLDGVPVAEMTPTGTVPAPVTVPVKAGLVSVLFVSVWVALTIANVSFTVPAGMVIVRLVALALAV